MSLPKSDSSRRDISVAVWILPLRDMKTSPLGVLSRRQQNVAISRSVSRALTMNGTNCTDRLVAELAQVVDLDSRVQATGGSALSTAKELLQQRHATRNVEAASQVIRQVRYTRDEGEVVRKTTTAERGKLLLGCL